MIDYFSKKVGIIGGGQLGKMMVQAASQMGIKTVVLDPDEKSPAAALSNENIVGAFDDYDAILELAKQTDVLTCEFEHISTVALGKLEQAGYEVYPSSQVLASIQNKLIQKNKLKNAGIPVGEFTAVSNLADVIKAGEEYGYPLMIKNALGAYDGKGNAVIESIEELESAIKELGGFSGILYVEKFVDFTKEISVICCGSINGEVVTYPIAQNVHVKSILDETLVPAELDFTQQGAVDQIARKVYDIFGTVGVLCVELFVTRYGDFLVNEVAPRPHNSGHFTIEGCLTSQFENHIRAVVGLPLGKTDLIMPSVMRNLIGEDDYWGKPFTVGVDEVLTIEGLKLHLYGKKEVKPKRKMGHLTVIANDLNEAREKASRAMKIMKRKGE